MQKKILLGVLLFCSYKFQASDQKKSKVSPLIPLVTCHSTDKDRSSQESYSPSIEPSPHNSSFFSHTRSRISESHTSTERSSHAPSITQDTNNSPSPFFERSYNDPIPFQPNDNEPFPLHHEKDNDERPKPNTPVSGPISSQPSPKLDLQKIDALYDQYFKVNFGYTAFLEANIDAVLKRRKHLSDMKPRELRSLLNEELSPQTKAIVTIILNEFRRNEEIENLFKKNPFLFRQ